MLQDILAGRPTEIEALNAQVATRGRALGLPTPVNDLLTLSPPRRGAVRPFYRWDSHPGFTCRHVIPFD